MTNPPYGERISAPDLLGLYRTIGERLKHQFLDNDAWILSYREECFDQIGLKPSIKIPLYNGSLECEFRKYQIFSGKYKDIRSEGREIKTDEERRQMAEKRRFKMHREFKQSIDDEEEGNYRFKKRRFDDRDGRPRGGGYASDRYAWDNQERREGREHYGKRREGRSADYGKKNYGREKKPFNRNRKNSLYDEED